MGVREGVAAGMDPEAEDERGGVVVAAAALVAWGGEVVGTLAAAALTRSCRSPMSLASTSNVGRLWGSSSQQRSSMLE